MIQQQDQRQCNTEIDPFIDSKGGSIDDIAQEVARLNAEIRILASLRA